MTLGIKTKTNLPEVSGAPALKPGKRFSGRNRFLIGFVLGVGVSFLMIQGWRLWVKSRLLHRQISPLADPAFFPRQAKDFPDRAKLEVALGQARKELESNPSSLDSLIVSGLAYFAMGREHAVDALNQLEQARDLGSVDPRVSYYLANLYGIVGLKNYAVREYDRFLRTHPNDELASLEAAKMHFEMGNFQVAAQLYEKLLERLGDKKSDPVILENLAMAQFKLEQWEKTRSLLEKLRSQDSENFKESAYFLAESLRKLVRCQEAMPLYAQALEAPLDTSKKILVHEGELACLQEIIPVDTDKIIESAKRLSGLDSKNKSAKAVLKKFSKSSKKKDQ